MAHNNIPDIGEALTNLPGGGKKKLNVQPKDTSKGHFYVSLVKSFVRIAAGSALIMAWVDPMNSEAFVAAGGGLLIVAEILGIVEEVV